MNATVEENAAVDAASAELAKLCGCGEAECRGPLPMRDSFIIGWRARAAEEPAHAADLWERLVTIWESDDGPTKAYDHEILERIAALVDEWQGFVGKKEQG
jgi:hypothetical protein